ncbi:hypothetical protein LTS10_004447 [Elasticomyces elasticus]|nr:hypothetical protein LTS10_004447 [Elasticomyces elasticus]
MLCQILTSILLFAAATTALKRRANLQTCPLLAKQYPSPVGLAEDPIFKAAIASLDATLDGGANVLPYNETNFSLGIFNPSTDGFVYQYHHSDAALAASSYGTKSIDADSIYRVGSISKLLTMYIFLLAANGDRYFNTPVLELVPELKQLASDEWNPETPDFSEITIGDLAGQMAGMARDLYINGIATGSPIFPIAYTPVYSNEAFALIGVALSHLVGRSFEAVFNETLRSTLPLSNTYFTVPSDIGQGVIPGTPLSTGFDGDLGVFSPAGGFFSSLNDFACLGKAILNSTFLSKAHTRRWFKPTSFVEDLAQGVGRPWEIFRRQVNGYTVDLYTKAGDIAAYSSFFALVPTYDIGITLMTAWDPAGTSGGVVRNELPNQLFNALLPALDEIAKKQAVANFAGQYINPQTNSSITIGTDANPALKVTAWSFNGVDIFNNVLGLLAPDLDLRILPNELYQESKVGFTSYYQSAAPPPANGTWYLQCSGWIDVDELTVRNLPLGQLVFTVGEDGKAMSVESRALRQVLIRQG